MDQGHFSSSSLSEAQGKVRVLLVDFERLGMTKCETLESLRSWFAQIESAAEQIQMDAEMDLHDSNLAAALPQDVGAGAVGGGSRTRTRSGPPFVRANPATRSRSPCAAAKIR